jgi:hypothetical protein
VENRKPLDGLLSTVQLSELQKMADAVAPFAKGLTQLAELSSSSLTQLQKMMTASSPYLTEMARLSDLAASRMAELQQISAQVAPRLLEFQRAAEAAAPRMAEMARWVDLTAARFKEAQEVASPAFEQMRRMAEIISPQIVELSKVRDLFVVQNPSSETLSSLLRVPVSSLQAAGTSPHAISLTIGVAGSTVGLRPHEMLGVLAAEARARAANDDGSINEGESSLAAEAFAILEGTESSDAAFALEFLDQFIATARSYLIKADSLPALKGLIQLITLMIAVASLLYASQSATTTDIDKLTSAVRELTAVEQQRIEQSDLLFREKMDQLIATTQNLAASQITSIAPMPLYRAKRSIPAGPATT